MNDDLPYFANLDRVLQTYGEEYDAIKRRFYWSLVGTALSRKVLELGAVRVDSRIHLAVPLPSGHGKRNFHETAKQILGACGLRVTAPTSYHPEQFIGKTIIRKKRVQEPGEKRARNVDDISQNPGMLADDFLVIEEASELFLPKDPDARECGKYLRVGLDPYGRNEVCKRLVDFKAEESLRYYPHGTAMCFFQPQWGIPRDVVENGLLRRFWIAFKTFPQRDWEREHALRVNGPDEFVRNSDVKIFSDFLRLIKHKISEKRFSVEPDAVPTFLKLEREVQILGADYSEKGRRYTEIMGFPLQDRLLQLSWLRAAIAFRDHITIEDVEEAFLDLWPFFRDELDFLELKVEGKFDYGESLSTNEILAIEFIRDGLKANTKTTIRSLVGFLQAKMECSEGSARGAYQKMCARGIITSRQVGQHDSEVFLSPGFLAEDVQGARVQASPSNLYQETFSRRRTPTNAISTPLGKTLTPSTPSNVPPASNTITAPSSSQEATSPCRDKKEPGVSAPSGPQQQPDGPLRINHLRGVA